MASASVMASASTTSASASLVGAGAAGAAAAVAAETRRRNRRGSEISPPFSLLLRISNLVLGDTCKRSSSLFEDVKFPKIRSESTSTRRDSCKESSCRRSSPPSDSTAFRTRV